GLLVGGFLARLALRRLVAVALVEFLDVLRNRLAAFTLLHRHGRPPWLWNQYGKPGKKKPVRREGSPYPVVRTRYSVLGTRYAESFGKCQVRPHAARKCLITTLCKKRKYDQVTVIRFPPVFSGYRVL